MKVSLQKLTQFSSFFHGYIFETGTQFISVFPKDFKKGVYEWSLQIIRYEEKQH